MLHIKGTAVLDTLEAIKTRAGKTELDKIISRLDPEAREIFRQPISPSSWYSCDAFSRFLEADIRETAGGNEQEPVRRAEAVIEKQLSGIYKMFVRLGSPEFVIRRIATASRFPLMPENNSANWLLLEIETGTMSVAIRLRENNSRVAVPESELRAGILRRNRRQPKARAFQIRKTLELQVPPIRISNQDVIDSILSTKNTCSHDTTSRKVVRLSGNSFHSVF